MDDNDVVIFSTFIIGILCLVAGIIGMSYWDAQQVRVMYQQAYAKYQQAYAKNMECRVATIQSRGSDFVNKVCGEIPKFEDYDD